MRRRNNTHCQFEEPKEIDRFKKRNPARILFAEEVNYSMTINDPLESSQKSSNSSKGSSKEETPFQNFASEEYTMEEIKPQQHLPDTKQKGELPPEQMKTQFEKAQKSQSFSCKDLNAEKEGSSKKSVLIIGDALQYEQKTKGFRKGMRRRYSHKNEADYMTY